MAHGDGGKGSAQRPSSISGNEFDNRWEMAFGKKKKVPEEIDTSKYIQQYAIPLKEGQHESSQ